MTKEEMNERRKKRYYNDPEFRQKQLDAAKRYHANKRKNDPDYVKRRAEYNKTNAEYLSQKQKEYNKAHPFTYAFRRLRLRAKQHNIPFSLTEEYLTSLWTGVCAIFGTNLEYPYSTKSQDPNKATIDKIVPELGYVVGNVHWVSNKANIIKSFGTEEEHQLIVDYFKRYRNGV